MTKFALLLVRLYWVTLSPLIGRRCLYRESCSCHVYRVLTDEGLTAGLSALRRRLSTCRPGFILSLVDDGVCIVTRDRTIIRADQVNREVFRPAHFHERRGVALEEEVHDADWGHARPPDQDDQGHTLYFGQPR